MSALQASLAPPANGAARCETLAARLALTRRQVEVLALVARGCSNRHVARELGVTVGAVERHVGALLARLRCTNRSQLVARVWGADAPRADLEPRVAGAAGRWKLTRREADVLALVALGRTNAAIARALWVSEKTVEVWVTGLLRKARERGRAALAARIWAGPA